MIRPVDRIVLGLAVVGAGVLGIRSTDGWNSPVAVEPTPLMHLAPTPPERAVGIDCGHAARPVEAHASAVAGPPRTTATTDCIAVATTQSDAGALCDAAEINVRRLREWARAEPLAAARAASELPPAERRLAIAGVVGVWTESALAEALEWASGLADEPIRTEAMLAVGYELARSRPAETLQFLAGLRRSPEVNALLVHAVTQWATLDPVAAARWSSAAAGESARSQLQAAIAQAWGEHDALSALAFALESLPPGTHQDVALAGITLRWVQQAPADVAAVLENFPDGGLRDAILKEVVRTWSSRDPRATEAWLSGLRCEAMRSRGLRFLAVHGAAAAGPIPVFHGFN